MATDNSPVVTEEKLLYFYNTYLKPYINAESGGHAIKNENDLLPLEQRETMVLNTPLMGLDDSTNEATVLDVDTNVDLSVIHAPGTAGNVEGHIYSTEEHVVGKWIDGKPIYEKTISNINISVTSTTKVYTIQDLSSIPVENFINIKGIIKIGNEISSLSSTYYNDPNWVWSIRYNTSNSNLEFLNRTESNQTITVTVTIQYTKTTDTV